MGASRRAAAWRLLDCSLSGDLGPWYGSSRMDNMENGGPAPAMGHILVTAMRYASSLASGSKRNASIGRVDSRRLGSGTLLLLVGPLWCVAAQAQAGVQSSPPSAVSSPSTAAVPETRCQPECREGFSCQAGRCISQCNPPCASNQVCVEGRRCEFIATRPATPAIYEPPAPPPPPRRAFDARAHTMLGFHWGFSGSVEQGGAERDLNSTLGFNLRTDFPVVRYLLIGPLFQFGAWQPKLAPGHNYYVDIALFLRGRIPIDLGDNHLQIWGGIPIGISASVFGDANVPPNVSDAGWGWNVGGLVGSAFQLDSGFGLFAELGWLQHQMSHSGDGGAGLDFLLAQWVFNVGFAFKN